MSGTTLRLTPLRRRPHERGLPLRTRPEHGPPRCVVEQFLQHVWTHKLAWYVAAAVTLMLALQLGVGPVVHDWLYR